jgi:hypothetical protein
MTSKQPKYHLNVYIDKLTNSIENTISGDSFATDILELTNADLKNTSPLNGWNFDWRAESRMVNRKVYKLTIKGNPKIIQGLASISNNGDHFYLHLVESAPFNLGKKKLYEGVPGNLFAFACKLSLEAGYEGFVAFQSKSKLIAHYEETIGATHIGGNKMIIFPNPALKLINKYFQI